MDQDDSPVDNQGGGEGQKEEVMMEEEEEDESSYCPVFSSSEHFHFMTTQAYLKSEECPAEENSGGDHDGVVPGESEKHFRFVRPMRARLALLENPHGSVRLWQGGTGVIAAVYGPSDVRMSKELPHRAAVDVLFRPKVTGTGNLNAMLAAGLMDPVMEERAIEQTIATVLDSVVHLEDHPQAGFNVILHEFENDGCLLSTCVNAACIALLNAGCSLRSIFAAVTIGVCGDKLIIDPCSQQIEELKTLSVTSDSPYSLSTFIVTNSRVRSSYSPQVLHVSTQGRVTPKNLQICYKIVTGNDKLMSELFGFVSRVLIADLCTMPGVNSSDSTLAPKNVKAEEESERRGVGKDYDEAAASGDDEYEDVDEEEEGDDEDGGEEGEIQDSDQDP